jgi:hypothetical protein
MRARLVLKKRPSSCRRIVSLEFAIAAATVIITTGSFSPGILAVALFFAHAALAGGKNL